MKYAVIGAGMMGSAVAYDLATRNPNAEVILVDKDYDRALQAARAIARTVRPLQLDVHNREELAAAIRGCRVMVGAVSYAVNVELSRLAIDEGVHFCDLGGNDDVVRQQLSLDTEAKTRDVLVVPNCGLAPGLIEILAMEGVGECDAVESVTMRVGGLPQHPRPPLNYQLVFSAEGLLNEYLEPATVIRDGEIHQVDSLSGLEEITFPEPFGSLEAFYTSGGASLLPHLLKGRVKHLDYKTIRYTGHRDKFMTLLELGFASNEPLMVGTTLKTNREFFTDMLRKRLDLGDKDVVLGRATIVGQAGSARRVLAYEFMDYYDEPTKMTAMMRGTAFPASVIAQMIAAGTITARGVVLPELCVPAGIMVRELGNRNFRITKNVTDSRR
jgi:lysine 6-dehydrogenase